MIPLDLPSKRLTLSDGDRESIVLITGGLQPHHLHFAYTIQAAFPGMVKGWFALDPHAVGGSRPSKTGAAGAGARALSFGRKVIEIVRSEGIGRAAKVHGPRFVRRSVTRASSRLHLNFRDSFDYRRAEESVFTGPVRRLKSQAPIEPTMIASPNDDWVRKEIAGAAPYFLLSLGGPLISRATLETARGLAINTHAGWAPEMRGSYTTEQALYHRRADWIGNTVHITVPAADAGPILARSTAAIHDDDTAAECFFRVVALGNQLMARTVRKIMASDEITVYEQDRGSTFRASDLTPHRKRAVNRDMANAFLRNALEEIRAY